MPRWIVCLGGEDWWYHSHAHFDIQLMKRFAQHQPVLYVCTTGMRIPSLKRDHSFWIRVTRKMRSVAKSLRQVHQNLYVYSPFSVPAYRHAWGRAANRALIASQLARVYDRLNIRRPLLWVNTPTTWPAARRFACEGLVYQRTDDYAAYKMDNFNADYVRALDDALLQQADLVLHVSEYLHQRDAGRARRCLLLEQGVDERFFERNGHACPPDLAALPRPVVGYVGNLEPYKFDAALVEAVARALPECSFALVGPDHPQAAALKRLPNVHFLGCKPHELIPPYVRHFDVCMLPAAKTTWAMSSNPIKLMEYLAAGRPTLSTDTPAARRFRNHIDIADDPRTWADTIRDILEKRKTRSPEKPAAGTLVSWTRQAERIRSALAACGLDPNGNALKKTTTTR